MRVFFGTALTLALLSGPSAAATPPTVVMFMIDGLQKQPAQVAAANGATNLQFFINNGVWVNEAYCNNPFFYVQLPNGSQPWGTTTPPNVMMHTGTHIAESRSMDDIFLSATRSGIRSVFAGGAGNYSVFTTATYLHVSGSASDAQVVDWGLQRLTQDGARLIRLHPQRIRDAWTGPTASVNPSSAYQAAIRNVDVQLGRLVTQLKNMGLWENTYVILSADHGMQPTSASGHPANYRSSWEPFMVFYGPGIKKGATIPYAESSDLALMAAHFLGIERPRGHDATVNVNPRGPTGTFLSNIFEGQPESLSHPQYVRRYLVSRNWAPPDNWTDYRSYMLSVLPQTPRVTPTPTPTATPAVPTPTPTPTPTACSGCQIGEITPPGSSVTASTHDGNLPANTVDNSLASRWAGNGDGAWIRYDLGTQRLVTHVRIAVYNGNSRQNRFDLQVSADGATWQNVLTGAQTSGTTTAEETHDFADVLARYVRYVGHMSNVGTFNSLTEVSVFGHIPDMPTPTPSPTPTAPVPTPTPTATPETPTATPTVTPTPAGDVEITPSGPAVTASTHDGNIPANTVDASLATRWSANGDGQWIQYDLGSTRTLAYARVAWYQGNARTSTFDLQISAAPAGPWSPLLTGRQSQGTLGLETHDFTDTSGRYVRLVGHGNSVNAWNSVTEVELWGR